MSYIYQRTLQNLRSFFIILFLLFFRENMWLTFYKRTLQDSLNDNFYFETFSFIQVKSLKAYPKATILVRF